MPEPNIPRKRSLRPHCKTGKTLICAACGTPFYVQKCRLKRKGNRAPKYCSVVCKARTIHTTHGAARRGVKTVEYQTWLRIKNRVKTKGRHYRWYGAKGITIDPEWEKSFDAFLRDMGNRPDWATSIDRIDGTKGYFKENCRWATQKQQNRNNSANRMLTLDGKTQCTGAWAEETGLGEATIRGRLDRGWSEALALQTPPTSPQLWEHEGRRLTLRQWSEECGLSISILKQRLSRGWNISQAVTTPRHTKFCTIVYREALAT